MTGSDGETLDSLADVLADADGATRVLLTRDERDRYERLARAVLARVEALVEKEIRDEFNEWASVQFDAGFAECRSRVVTALRALWKTTRDRPATAAQEPAKRARLDAIQRVAEKVSEMRPKP